jgi:ABC-type sugar transport system ATPase subunit
MTSSLNTLSVKGLTKAFEELEAVKNVSFTFSNKEVVALAGGNGSGKSTLLKMIAGTLQQDLGSVKFNERILSPGNISEARKCGIQMVFQDGSLCPDANVVENMFLGNEIKSALGFLKTTKMKEKTLALIEQYQLPIPNLNAKAFEMSGGQRKSVAIGRALLSEPQFLLLDEPTAALGVKEQQMVVRMVKELNHNEVGVLICTHSPEEVLNVASRVIILRSGKMVIDRSTNGLTKAELAILMSE